jgi:hypothetical protein
MLAHPSHVFAAFAATFHPTHGLLLAAVFAALATLVTTHICS